MFCAIPPHPQFIFMMWYLVKHRDNFIFYLKLYYTMKCMFDIVFMYSLLILLIDVISVFASLS
jgi:hypothetical protein